MRKAVFVVCLLLLAGVAVVAELGRASARHVEKLQRSDAATSGEFLGLDRNLYPGEENLKVLARRYAFTGYWLNTPPGEQSNSWQGKRAAVVRAGMGFLLLYNGKTYQQILQAGPSAGTVDGAEAVRAARAEGFATGSILFLDIEEGGRMLAEQKSYIFAWAQAVRQAGMQPGVYCSGIDFTEGDGATVSTASDLHDTPQGRDLVFWVANDACPPSPGCLPKPKGLRTAGNGLAWAEIWQYAQSPVRPVAQACRQTYNADGDCRVMAAAGTSLHVDLNVARSKDPSHGRR